MRTGCQSNPRKFKLLRKYCTCTSNSVNLLYLEQHLVLLCLMILIPSKSQGAKFQTHVVWVCSRKKSLESFTSHPLACLQSTLSHTNGRNTKLLGEISRFCNWLHKDLFSIIPNLFSHHAKITDHKYADVCTKS